MTKPMIPINLSEDELYLIGDALDEYFEHHNNLPTEVVRFLTSKQKSDLFENRYRAVVLRSDLLKRWGVVKILEIIR